MRKVIRVGIRFAIVIALLLAFAGLFSAYASGSLSQEQQDRVVIKAIPFVAVFVSIILGFVFIIVATARLLHGRVPERSYRPIEAALIGGIVLGALALFQGWRIFAYEYGFLLLLGSTLVFMIWSHVTPMSAAVSRRVPPLERRAHLIGLAVGAVVWAVVMVILSLDAQPVEPYGARRQIWDLMMDDAQRAAAEEAAWSLYRQNQLPVFALISLLPAAVAYFGLREVASDTRPDISAPAEQVTTGPAPVAELRGSD